MQCGNDSRSKVLVIDADNTRAALLRERLDFLDYQPVTTESALGGAASDGIAVVVGVTADNKEAAATLDRIRRSNPGLPFLCLPDSQTPECGPNWTLDLPLRRSQLARLLDRAERYQGSDRRHRITGSSHPVRAVRRLIEQVADFETSVLVTGESGTGKELVARTVHELSERADKPFVPINCGAIPADLLESELFGHVKGAFTGAIASRKGRFELAQGGTLFLDEIGEMSMAMQVKLLRVLQERSFEAVGSNTLKNADVRVIAATHVDLPAAIQQGEFREDLFYRLNVFPIEMPPLYKRTTDIPQLLDELLLDHAEGGAPSLRLSPAAMRALAKYRWPGNIRELSNLVERLAILNPEGIIDVDDLPAKYRAVQATSAADSNTVCQAMRLSEDNLKEHLAGLEQELISQAMAASDGVVAKAARLLSLRRTTLVEKIAKFEPGH